METRTLGVIGVLALAAISAGCLGVNSMLGDDGATLEPASDPAPEVYSLTILVTASENAIVEPELLSVHAEPRPEQALIIEEGPGPHADGDDVIALDIKAEENRTLESFELEMTVHDGLGPAKLSLDVPSWQAEGDAKAHVELDMPEVGLVEVERVHGDVHLEALENPSTPKYGYLDFASGAKKPLEDFPHVINLPEDYPRFPPGSEPTFELEEEEQEVRWSLNGAYVSEANSATLDPDPGTHTLTVQDLSSDAKLELDFSINQRFVIEDAVLVGTAFHRESLAEANEDTHEVNIREGATVLRAFLEPLGKHTDIEDLDLYALNETGGVLDQGTGNTTEETVTLPRSALIPGETIHLKVHGNVAAHTEYQLSVSTFYSPWG